ncbi:uncharacterized protein [Drosophila kikkawai]|uniref:RNA-directed DNA polymerase n=1 Tax=Drosophila kikkawai TaxID=30033 RepID=A0ABM4GFY0_DROKI
MILQVTQEPGKFPDYRIEGGQLYRMTGNTPQEEDQVPWKLCVGQEYRQRVLQECHDHPTAGHLGTRKTGKRVAQKYYWPGLFREVTNIKENAFKATLDTGATRSFISEQRAAQIGRGRDWREIRTRIRLADGSHRDLTRGLVVTIHLGQQQVKLFLLVMPTVLDDILLGIDFLCGIKAIISCGGEHLQLDSRAELTNEENPEISARNDAPSEENDAPNEECVAAPSGILRSIEENPEMSARNDAPNEECVADPPGISRSNEDTKETPTVKHRRPNRARRNRNRHGDSMVREAQPSWTSALPTSSQTARQHNPFRQGPETPLPTRKVRFREPIVESEDGVRPDGSTSTDIRREESLASIDTNTSLTAAPDTMDPRRSLKYLGHVISESGIHTDPDKIAAIRELQPPTNVRELRSLGVASRSRRFVPNFAAIVEPISTLLRKGRKWSWDTEQEQAFETLKTRLTEAPVLACPDFTQKFSLQTDASDHGLGAVLLQSIDGVERVIAYASQRLTRAEENYSVTEKECLAIVWAIRKMRCYLEGYRFEVVRDHLALKWLNSIDNPTGRIARWALELQQYQFDVQYRRGKFNIVADALSRQPLDTV